LSGKFERGSVNGENYRPRRRGKGRNKVAGRRRTRRVS
jgi:hypothetical protein